jgi:hypothetical protein
MKKMKKVEVKVKVEKARNFIEQPEPVSLTSFWAPDFMNPDL